MESLRVRVVPNSSFIDPPPRILEPGGVVVVEADERVHVADASVGVVVIISDGVGAVTVATPKTAHASCRGDQEAGALIDRGLAQLGEARFARAVLLSDSRSPRSRVLANRIRSLLQARQIPIVVDRGDGAVRALEVDGYAWVRDQDTDESFSLNAIYVPARRRRAYHLSHVPRRSS